MGIFNWFRSGNADDGGDGGQRTDDASAGDKPGATVAGLNFMTAIDAHMKWKTRLESQIHGDSQEDLQAEIVSRDDACQLGQWIHGIGGERFGGLDIFKDMKAQHAHFHACAGRVLTATRNGRAEDALHMLQQGEYVRASERVKMLLAKLYVQIVEGR